MGCVIFRGFALNVITIIQIYNVTLLKVTASAFTLDNVKEEIIHMLPESLQWTYNDSFIVVERNISKSRRRLYLTVSDWASLFIWQNTGGC